MFELLNEKQEQFLDDLLNRCADSHDGCMCTVNEKEYGRASDLVARGYAYGLNQYNANSSLLITDKAANYKHDKENYLSNEKGKRLVRNLTFLFAAIGGVWALIEMIGWLFSRF